MDVKEILIASVKKNVNLPGLVSDSLDQILAPALQKVVQDSSNPFDDVLYAAVYPLLAKALKEEVQKLYDQLLG